MREFIYVCRMYVFVKMYMYKCVRECMKYGVREVYVYVSSCAVYVYVLIVYVYVCILESSSESKEIRKYAETKKLGKKQENGDDE